jgi:hypothetical protein
MDVEGGGKIGLRRRDRVRQINQQRKAGETATSEKTSLLDLDNSAKQRSAGDISEVQVWVVVIIFTFVALACVHFIFHVI